MLQYTYLRRLAAVAFDLAGGSRIGINSIQATQTIYFVHLVVVGSGLLWVASQVWMLGFVMVIIAEIDSSNRTLLLPFLSKKAQVIYATISDIDSTLFDSKNIINIVSGEFLYGSA